MSETTFSPKSINTAAYILAGLTLLFFLSWHLIPAVIAALFIHELVHYSASKVVKHTTLKQNIAKLFIVSVIAIVVITVLAVLMTYLIDFFRNGNENLPDLLKKMAEALETSKASLPAWLVNLMPQDLTEIKKYVIDWLRSHAAELTAITKTTLRIIAHVLIGMIIGAMIALYEIAAHIELKPLAKALTERARLFSDSFRQIVFAQIRIAALNTVFTAIYLAVVLPLFDIKLPFLMTMILLTFIFGLLPVIGNILSNIVIVVVSLSVSFQVAIISLVYLVVIHKVEYFLNAKIIGSQIKTRAWEILIAMLVLETVFGVVGVIVAPIYYAYIKKELRAANLV